MRLPLVNMCLRIIQKVAQIPSGNLRVAYGDVKTLVCMVLILPSCFRRKAKSLISMKYGGREMIEAPLLPLFWRATTDNDRGLFSRVYTQDAGMQLA